MDQQIQQAVEIALSGNSDANLKNQAFEFINQIKSSTEGYTSCLALLTKNSTLTEGTRFFILQVIDENIQRLSDQELFQLSEILFKHLTALINSNSSTDPIYLRNKFTSTFGTLFCYVYLNIQPNILKNLLSLIKNSSNNDLAIDYYLRVIIAIHFEISDKFITRSREVMDRNNLLKDAIRVNDMVDLTDSWKTILNSYSMLESNQLQNDILNNCLIIVGQYINWMDINLFISNDFINLIFKFLTKDAQKVNTCNTLIEIISKKMKPINKLQLISLLNLTGLIGSIDLNNSDMDFIEHIAKLSNAIGIELLIVLEDTESTDDIKLQTNQQILELWPLILIFLSHEYDDVSQHVFPFISSYLLLLKKFKNLISNELLSTLLNKVIIKMKYDDDDDGEDNDSIDLFNEVRSKLKNFQDTIAVLNPELYVQTIPIVINESIFNNTAQDWRRLELGLYELSNFSDSLRNNLLNLPKQQINNSKPFTIFQDFLVKVINSNDILKIGHPLTRLIFFELIVRHYNFFNNSSVKNDLSSRILEIFTSDSGLFNNDEKVKLRCWYLFFRFVKLTKPVLKDAVLETLIVNLSTTLLIMDPKLPTVDDDEDIITHGNFSSQLYLFEAIGTLISTLDNSKIDLKVKLIEMILQPLFNDLNTCIGAGDKFPIIVLLAHHALMSIGTFAGGYDIDLHNKYPDQVVQQINNASQVVLITLENFIVFESVRDAARFSFARFIPILKNSIKLHLSKLISLILSSDLKFSELTDFLSFLGQIIHSYNKDDNIYMLLNDLLTPLFNKIFNMLNNNGEDNEFESMPNILRDKSILKRTYISFLITLTQNNVTSLLITETNKNVVPVVLESLFTCAYNIVEPTTSRVAITELTNIVNVIGNGKINDTEDLFGANLSIDGIDEFLLNNITTLIFELPFKNESFLTKDPQIRSIGQELALLLKSYYLVKNQLLIDYLKSYFQNIGLSMEMSNEFLKKLIDLDQKDFKKFFIQFIESLKGK